MKIKNIFILLFYIANSLCIGQNVNFEKKDSLVVINGDTAIYNVLSSSRINGLFMMQGSVFVNNKGIALNNVFQKDNNKNHGINITYNNELQIRSCLYAQYEFPNIYDTMPNGDFLFYKKVCYEGIIIDGSLYENRIISFSVVDQENKIKTSFILDKHSRISKRIYYNNDEKPYRIIFFTKKMKIKGDFKIEEADLKNKYEKYKYWKHN